MPHMIARGGRRKAPPSVLQAPYAQSPMCTPENYLKKQRVDPHTLAARLSKHYGRIRQFARRLPD